MSIWVSAIIRPVLLMMYASSIGHQHCLGQGGYVLARARSGTPASGTDDLESDLAAIRDSFGTARGEDVSFGRGSDERARHLDRMVELWPGAPLSSSASTGGQIRGSGSATT
jgi:hypothetical protein